MINCIHSMIPYQNFNLEFKSFFTYLKFYYDPFFVFIHGKVKTRGEDIIFRHFSCDIHRIFFFLMFWFFNSSYHISWWRSFHILHQHIYGDFWPPTLLSAILHYNTYDNVSKFMEMLHMTCDSPLIEYTRMLDKYIFPIF